jgi:CheY-like chemotaxis protein/AraC-like DNA-binding protein
LPFDAMAADRKITIRRFCHFSVKEFPYDEEALRKVLTNLLSNAIKFTPEGGRIDFFAAMIPSCDTNNTNSTLYICVSDTGGGIAEDEIDHVFERFYQGKSEIKYPITGSAGSGIGLYLCKSIIEMYKGEIFARNNHGRGCSFRVFIPVGDADKEPAQPVGNLLQAPAAEADNGDSVVDTGTTVLVVDDNADMRSFIRSILAEHYTVVEAANGQEALNILLERNIDFIVSDLMMPVMDGLELSRRVKENFSISHIPFLMLTAKTTPDARLESYRIGVDEYLLKPFDEAILLARIEGILRNKRRYQNNFSLDMNVDELNIETESRDSKFVNQVMDVIKENYKNSYFEVGDFAETLGVSRSLLNKKLQSLIGQSAGQFIRNYRLNLAKEMILKNRKNRSMNISEIAYEVGFNDSKYFTRCFTKHFNITPSAMLNNPEQPDN